MSGSNGGGTRPVMMDENSLPAGNNTHWIPSSSTYATGGFYLEQKGYSNNKMNLRDGFLAYWSTGKDMGSTFTATERIMEGTATGIDEIVTDADRQQEGIYDLGGRRIKEITTKGFYIVNGEKVMVE